MICLLSIYPYELDFTMFFLRWTWHATRSMLHTREFPMHPMFLSYESNEYRIHSNKNLYIIAKSHNTREMHELMLCTCCIFLQKPQEHTAMEEPWSGCHTSSSSSSGLCSGGGGKSPFLWVIFCCHAKNVMTSYVKKTSWGTFNKNKLKYIIYVYIYICIYTVPRYREL